VWRIVVKAGAHHPSDFSVGFDSFADETCIGGENKVAFQTTPDETELVAIRPYVGSSALDYVLISWGIIPGVTGANRIADVVLTSEGP
jgi:hypothetical protein